MKPNSYVLYARVSTERQGRSQLGLEAQLEAMNAFVAARSGHIVATFTEVESGGSALKREALKEAIRTARLCNSVLLIAKLDRLTRDLWFLTTIQRLGIHFVCADQPEINELTVHILGAMAQHERRLVSERTRSALASAKARGKTLGNPNLHEVRNTDLKAATKARKAAADDFAAQLYDGVIKHLAEDGVRSLSETARRLNQRGFLTRRGKKWTACSVRRLLDRKDHSPQRVEHLLGFVE